MKIYLVITLLLLVGCGQGDRGGVSLGSQESENTSSSSSGLGPMTEEFTFIISSVGKCLNMDLSDYLSLNQKSKIYSWDCAPLASYQQWIWSDSGEIQSKNGLCLALAEEFNDGVEVVATKCSEADDQQWVYDEFTSVIKNIKYVDYCLDIFSNNLHLNGRAINIFRCNYNINQRWTIAGLKSNKIRSYTYERLYLNIQPSNTEDDLKVSPISEGWASALWLFEPSENTYRIRSLWRPDQFLHIQNGGLEIGNIDIGWKSARWILIPQRDTDENAFLLRNAWKPEIYIGLNSQNDLIADEFSDLVDNSYIWIFSEI